MGIIPLRALSAVEETELVFPILSHRWLSPFGFFTLTTPFDAATARLSLAGTIPRGKSLLSRCLRLCRYGGFVVTGHEELVLERGPGFDPFGRIECQTLV